MIVLNFPRETMALTWRLASRKRIFRVLWSTPIFALLEQSILKGVSEIKDFLIAVLIGV